MKCQKCGKETDTLYMTRFGDYCEDCTMEKYNKGELDKIFVKTEVVQELKKARFYLDKLIEPFS